MENRYQKLVKQMVADKQLPQYFYRMRTVNRYLFDSLINSEMWFSNPVDFNDPFDCDINMKIKISTKIEIQNYFEEHLAKLFDSSELNDIDQNNISRDHFEILINKAAKRVTQRKGIACFMSNCKSLLMWAHYANSHKGICFKFDVLEDLDFFSPVKKVIYANEYPEYDYISNKDEFVNQMFFTKSKEWNYEGEVRVLKKQNGNYKFSKNSLREVIFGCKIAKGDKKTLVKIIKDYYPQAKLTQAVKHDSKFRLEFKKIE